MMARAKCDLRQVRYIRRLCSLYTHSDGGAQGSIHIQASHWSQKIYEVGR